ncbi:MAG: hypothetical protein ACI8UO_006470 [Verrucomicrobiales bacterium]|jgi:hypothetical protein
MKIALITVGSVLGTIALFFGFIYFATSGVAKAGDEFIDAIASEDRARIEACLSSEFLKASSWGDLDGFLKENELYKNEGVFWNSREFQNNAGKLEGSVTLKSGRKFPVQLNLLKNDGEWKIFSISRQISDAGLVTNPSLPELSECAAIVKETTRQFSDAINDGSFGDFHAGTAPEFQRDVPLDSFTDKFGEFLKSDLDLSGLQHLDPAFAVDPTVNGNGVLILEGYFPTEPSRAEFSYHYLRRLDEWQLVSVGFHIKPIED